MFFQGLFYFSMFFSKVFRLFNYSRFFHVGFMLFPCFLQWFFKSCFFVHVFFHGFFMETVFFFSVKYVWLGSCFEWFLDGFWSFEGLFGWFSGGFRMGFWIAL